jgi:hypothetical protein
MMAKAGWVVACLIVTAAAHSQNAPQPRVVDPGQPGAPPSDAIVLFSGKDLSEWVHRNGSPASWTLSNGEMVCKSGAGDIITRRKIGSAQFHVEFSTPNMPNAKDQARGNSGVYIQSRHEIQILDSYQNPTYANGSCGAVYGQYAPLVNVSRPPQQWQTYDIVFHAFQCTGGKVTQPGTLTIFQNGVLIQDHVALRVPRAGGAGSDPCAPAPLLLQDHYHPDVKETFMRFRNIWYRPLGD